MMPPIARAHDANRGVTTATVTMAVAVIATAVVLRVVVRAAWRGVVATPNRRIPNADTERHDHENAHD
jgi:hypothetical protein